MLDHNKILSLGRCDPLDIDSLYQLQIPRNYIPFSYVLCYLAATYYKYAILNGVMNRSSMPNNWNHLNYMAPKFDILHCCCVIWSTNIGGTLEGTTISFSSFCFESLGIESFSKLGDSIYFEEKGEIPGLYIIQYISSTIDWKAGNISLTQKVEPLVSWDNLLRVSITISSNEVPSTI